MCEALQEAIDLANLNTQQMAETIDALPIPCSFKGQFLHMADTRGFRFDDETLRQMEEIGRTKSDICLMLLEGKDAGLITVYRLATELETEKQRGQALEFIREQSKAKTITEKLAFKAIISVGRSTGSLFGSQNE